MALTDAQRAWARSGGSNPAWCKTSKLTPTQRDEIRRKLADGERTMDLAAEYKVSSSTIHRLRG